MTKAELHEIVDKLKPLIEDVSTKRVDEALDNLQRGVKHIIMKEMQQVLMEPALRQSIREAIKDKVLVEVKVQ